jgi:NAD(P)-dependent dehydrogenase (short-subunit alcohol dehydrogenase family)
MIKRGGALGSGGGGRLVLSGAVNLDKIRIYVQSSNDFAQLQARGGTRASLSRPHMARQASWRSQGASSRAASIVLNRLYGQCDGMATPRLWGAVLAVRLKAKLAGPTLGQPIALPCWCMPMNSEPCALVTGATGAIGSAIARGLAERGYGLILVARDQERGERLASALGGATRSIDVQLCDLGRLSEIEELSTRLPSSLDVLVNNAAECPRSRQVTPEGIERQWATNVLGYYRLIEACAPALERARGARVVNVASYWAGGLDLSDVEFRRRRYDNDAAYRQSKQADRMLTAGLAGRFAPRRVSLYACHPGDVRSKLSQDLGFGGHESAEEAADTPVWLATEPELPERTGAYFAQRRPERCPFSINQRQVEALLALCEQYR